MAIYCNHYWSNAFIRLQLLRHRFLNIHDPSSHPCFSRVDRLGSNSLETPKKRWWEHFIISGVLIISVFILYRAVHRITTGKYAMQNMETIRPLVTGFLVLIKMTETETFECTQHINWPGNTKVSYFIRRIHNVNNNKNCSQWCEGNHHHQSKFVWI